MVLQTQHGQIFGDIIRRIFINVMYLNLPLLTNTARVPIGDKKGRSYLWWDGRSGVFHWLLNPISGGPDTVATIRNATHASEANPTIQSSAVRQAITVAIMPAL